MRKLSIVIFCLFTSVNGALKLASQFPTLMKTEFPDHGLNVVPDSNALTYTINTNNDQSIGTVYDMDQIDLYCDEIQKQRLALLEPERHATAKWELETTSLTIADKFDIEKWHKRYWPEGIKKVRYMFVNGTIYRKEMVYCPSMRYTFSQNSSIDSSDYTPIGGCYFAPSDVKLYEVENTIRRPTNVFEIIPNYSFRVNYLGIDDELLFISEVE